MDDYEVARRERLARQMKRDKWLSLRAKEFDCELCARGKHNECVRPCMCKHLRR